MAETILEIKNIVKSFDGKLVHDGLSFGLKKGEILAIFGGSGTGKSVALRTIIGLEKPDAGKIIYKQSDISKYTEIQLYEVRKNISYVFQNGALFDSMSVYDNLAYPLEEHTDLTAAEINKKIKDLLALIGMDGSEQLLPASLSGGMQKRVGLARSIMLNPEIILYDEPTAGLDPANTEKILELMVTLKEKGSTAIFVTHDIPAAVEISDRIAILHEKKIYIIDTVKNIVESDDPIIRNFFSGNVKLNET